MNPATPPPPSFMQPDNKPHSSVVRVQVKEDLETKKETKLGNLPNQPKPGAMEDVMHDSGEISPEDVKAVVREAYANALENQRVVQSFMETQEQTPARGISTGKFKTRKKKDGS